ncbi:60S ribosomal protein L31 [Candidatus Woesearchaeota archaeon]|nr:60S ribosomal protein L31 [Candidatus Woesearchaeota archaeon]
MAEERNYIIPLRKEFIKAPNYKRSKKSIDAIKEFLISHMKGNKVKIGPHLNQAIWARGNKNPPPKIKIKASKDDKNVIRAELPEYKFEPIAEKKDKKGKKEEAQIEQEAKQESVDLSLDKNIKKAAKEQVRKSISSEAEETTNK